MILFQIYSYNNKFISEAVENHFSKSSDKNESYPDQIAKNKTDENVIERPKRPARLLPLKMIL